MFLGRFLGPLRAVIPFVAGISRMDARSFYFWNILSAILWSSSHLLAGNDTLLTDSLRKAGWQVPDPVMFGSVTRLASTLVQRSNYPAAPIAPIFWNGQTNELGFVKPTFTDTPGIRREARFWKTRLSTLDGREIYAGLVSQATGFRLWAIPKTSPDIDKERDELFHELQVNNLLFSDTEEAFVKPVARKSSGEITYFTDGLICVISLR